MKMDKTAPKEIPELEENENISSANIFQRQFLYIKNTLISLLKQGVTPQKIAMAMLMGYIAGTFPIPGTHLIIGVSLAFIFRLNQLAVYLGLWISLPPFLLFLLPSLRLGEFIFQVEPMNSERFIDNMTLMWNSQEDFFRILGEYGMSMVHISVGWLPIVIITGGPVFFISYMIAKRFFNARTSRDPRSKQ